MAKDGEPTVVNGKPEKLVLAENLQPAVSKAQEKGEASAGAKAALVVPSGKSLPAEVHKSLPKVVLTSPSKTHLTKAGLKAAITEAISAQESKATGPAAEAARNDTAAKAITPSKSTKVASRSRGPTPLDATMLAPSSQSSIPGTSLRGYKGGKRAEDILIALSAPRPAPVEEAV